MSHTTRSDYELPLALVGLLAKSRRSLQRHYAIVVLSRFLVVALAAFAVSWLLDYSPIWFGGHELPTSIRVGLLSTFGFVTLPPLVQGLRVLLSHRIDADNMALLIERKIPGLRNGLSTLLDARKSSIPVTENTRMMLATTESQVLAALQNFNPDSLFDHQHKTRLRCRARRTRLARTSATSAIARAAPR